MNTKRLHCKGGLIVTLVLLSLVSILAKDFWEEKPYTQWAENEAMALLLDSPWSRTQTVLGKILGAGESNSTRAKDLPRVITPGSTESSGAALTRTGVNFGSNDSLPVYVRWYSSIRVRQALGRLGQIQMNYPESEVKKFVEEPMEDYQVCIVAPLMDSFNELGMADLKDNTYLVSKKNKSKKLMLKSYTAPKDRKDGIALYSFPKTLDGKPAFDASDEEIQFVTQIRKSEIKASFKLNKMMTDGKLDL
jgi:hypothetical protein